MAPTLIAELYPLEKRAVRVSWIVAAAQLASLIGSPVTGLIVDTGGVASWRSALLWFMLPATSACLLLVIFLVPSKPLSMRFGAKKEPFLNGYKQVLTDKSAVAILANSFLGGAFGGWSVFAPAFLNDVFAVPPSLRGLVPVVAGSLLIAGMLIGGVLVNRVGRKRLLVRTAIPSIAFSIVAYTLSIFIPNVWIVLCLRFAAAFTGGLSLVAGPNLAMELVPKFRGTMLSLASALVGIGAAAGIFIAGALLDFINNPPIGYPIAAATLGALGIIGVLAVLFFAKDPVMTDFKQK